MNNHTEDKTVFDLEKLNAQLLTLDTIHNNAIQSCIDVVGKSLAWLHPEEVDAVISKLNNLKK